MTFLGRYSYTNNFDKEFTTDENGKIKVTGLKLGKYNYQEVKAPIGFACDKNTYSFTLSYKDQNTSVIKESASRNNKQVIFFKTDEKGVILSGGKFEILDKDGKSCFYCLYCRIGHILPPRRFV